MPAKHSILHISCLVTRYYRILLVLGFDRVSSSLDLSVAKHIRSISTCVKNQALKQFIGAVLARDYVALLPKSVLVLFNVAV